MAHASILAELTKDRIGYFGVPRQLRAAPRILLTQLTEDAQRSTRPGRAQLRLQSNPPLRSCAIVSGPGPGTLSCRGGIDISRRLPFPRRASFAKFSPLGPQRADPTRSWMYGRWSVRTVGRRNGRRTDLADRAWRGRLSAPAPRDNRAAPLRSVGCPPPRSRARLRAIPHRSRAQKSRQQPAIGSS